MRQKAFNLYIIIGYLFCCFITIESVPCNLRTLPTGKVCVCNKTYCDFYDDITLNKKNEYVIVSTSEAGLRFKVGRGQIEDDYLTEINVHNYGETSPFSSSSSSSFYMASQNDTFANININLKKRYQKIVGFGGAFTGAVSYIIEQIPKSLQHYLYRSYYSATDGNNFNIMRMVVGGCDFDLKAWTYAETPINDTTLSGFTSLNAEDMQKIRQIKELENVTNNHNIKRLAAAWSSPRWMKTPHKWHGPSQLIPEFYQTWADYHLRWLQLMKKEGFDYWAISTGNEPMDGVTNWPMILFVSLGWTAQHQGKWLAENFGPTLRASEFKDIKIITGDDQRNTLTYWVDQMNVGHPNASNFIDGIGVHWYQDYIVPASFLTIAHNKNPDKLIMNTEACMPPPIALGSWSIATAYIIDMIDDFNNYNQAWIYWNLWLNEFGQPNYINHRDNAPIFVNTTSGKEFYRNPWFYTMGHFSKFVLPDSVRVDVISDNENIVVTAFQRPDSNVVILMYNKSKYPAYTSITCGDKQFLIRMPTQTLQTLFFSPNN